MPVKQTALVEQWISYLFKKKGKVTKMKTLKKSIAIVLITVCTLSASVPALALGAKDFSDVKESDWFFHNVDVLVQMRMIDGYPDGAFHTQSNITVAEYLKTLVSFEYKQQAVSQGHWAINYMSKAEELKLIDAGEYPQNIWDTPITRQQMSKISVRYIIDIKGESPEPEGSLVGVDTQEYFKGRIADWDSIPDGYKEFVLLTYIKGITNGYEDGTFKGETPATRAEACAILLRTIAQGERIPFSIDPEADE